MAVCMKSSACKFYSSFNKGDVQLMQYFVRYFQLIPMSCIFLRGLYPTLR